MKKNRIIWLAVSCLMVISLLVTSCGGATTDDVIDDGDDNGVVDEEDIDEVTTETEEVGDGKIMVTNAAGKLVEKPRYGGYIHSARSTDVRGFDDVIAATPPYITTTLNLTHGELFTGDWSKGSQGTGEASFLVYSTYFPHLQAPYLATGYELPDSETIIWHIRKGVYWHNKPPVNGREYNAHDAAFNLERAFLTPGSYVYNVNRPDQDQGVISVTALDDWTVEMKVPADRQARILTFANDFVYHHAPEVIEQYGDADDWELTIGTGAFTMTDYVPVSSMTFERNPNYFEYNPLHPDDQLPYIDGVKIYVLPDLSTRQAAFRTGKLDYQTGMVKDDWEAVLQNTPELQWYQAKPVAAACIYLRQDNPELPYQDIRVRKALFYAIDHQEIIDYYYEGLAEMINGPISGLPEYAQMYTSLEEYPEEVQKLYGYYPDEARELLAEAGYPNGFQATILTADEGLIPIIMDYWSKIGVDLTIDLKTSQVVNSIVMGGKHEDMYYSAIGGYPLSCNHWRPDSFRNFSKVTPPEFDEWFDELSLYLLDWEKASEMYKEFETKMRARAYFIDLPNDYTYYVWWPWVKSWRGESSIGYWNTYQEFNYIWIDTDLRREMTGREE